MCGRYADSGKEGVKMSKTVLVTGAEGFVGRNLCVTLACITELTVLKFDLSNTQDELSEFASRADLVFHLAGVNRPSNADDFEIGNADFTEHLLSLLRTEGRKIPIVLCSSSQAALDNPYGISKRHAEESVFLYGRETGAEVFVYRLPNLFGKWCRPNYNSAVATWCHNIAHDQPIQVRDPGALLTLAYVDDVVSEFLAAFNGQANRLVSGYCAVPTTYTRSLGHITELLYSFEKSRATLQVPGQADDFSKRLYATFLSYLPTERFGYDLSMNTDGRGSFTEFLKIPGHGQVSVNVSKPGITKGNHWHHTKVEKFVVVSGQGVIRLRKLNESAVLEYVVSGDKLRVIDISPGYTHNIENVGNTDMVTIMWASEPFDPNKPDTFFEKV